ncbi:MAG: putative manganese-dependent inorganic diphosphatase [Lachnospirales bacterium]
MKKIHIFGHKNPDTDSICSTIAYANLKKELGFDVIPCRLGLINRETEYVLNYFSINKPELIDNVDTKISDLSLYPPSIVNKHDPVKKAWDILKMVPKSRLIPVVDKNNVLEGLVSITDITRLLMYYTNENVTERYEILFDNLLEILDSEVKYGSYKFRHIEGKIYIGQPPEDVTLKMEDVLITSRVKTAEKYLANSQCGCFIVTDGRDISSLKGSERAIVSVKNDIYKVVSFINQSISVGSIMQVENLETFSNTTFIEDIKNVLKDSPHRNFPVLNDENELIGIISRRHVIDYPRKICILVDHNERGQSADGIERADIMEIIDHHRVADVQTDQPLFIRSEPVGCTSTIIYKMYKENNIPIPKTIAGIMMSAILSDTLIFTSPTCTNSDKEICETLAEIAEIDMYEYGRNMFEAGSATNAEDIDDLIRLDCKAFSFGKSDCFISQFNTMDIEKIMKDENKIMEGLIDFQRQKNADIVVLMITDIIGKGSQIFVHGKDADMAKRAFEIPYDQDSKFLDGIVSRKKQVVPRMMMMTRML